MSSKRKSRQSASNPFARCAVIARTIIGPMGEATLRNAIEELLAKSAQ